MAPSRPSKKNKKQKKSTHRQAEQPAPELAQNLLEEATSLLHSGQAENAVPVAKKLLDCLSSIPDPLAKIPALELLGEIYVELGGAEQAREAFAASAALDPEATLTELEGGGADKFLWLAQLSEEGGNDSIKWYEKGIKVLKRELDTEDGVEEEIIGVKRRKLANALCGATEVYMTDLSWEDDAEAKCEAFITEACLVAPDTPEPLQTLASVRISQLKTDDAKAALRRSMEIWTHLEPEDPKVPEFPTRISLARLLMEVEMEDQAFEVLDRLVAEDDNSVEAWYLGGWCLRLLAVKRKENALTASETLQEAENAEIQKLLKGSKRWLKNSLKLYTLLEYEDDRLHDHANELVSELNQALGITADEDNDSDAEDDDELWEDAEDSDEDDEEMGNA